MIAVANANGELLKLLPEASGEFGLHQVFGFITKDSEADRIHRRKAQGMKTTGSWLSELKFSHIQNKINLESISGCEVKRESDTLWRVTTPSGIFTILPASAVKAPSVLGAHEDTSQFKKAVIVVALLLLMVPILLGRGKSVEMVVPIMEPVLVKLEKQVQKPVVVPSAVPLETKEIKQIVKEDKVVKRAIQQNLGFLGLLGNKNLSKAIGGVPTQVKEASAGAGAGGNAGSGGELLVGLGAGVKHATVGNTGVAGLGGIGTKGAGGGAGGYGTSQVGSGEGRSLSKVALSQDMFLEGGLDRAVIQATIAKYLSQVRACYEQGLQSNPGLAGQVNMNFVIAGSGAVSTAKVGKSSLGNAQVEGCIETKMMNWQFPKPVGGVNVKVNYPFVLRPVGA
jgi:hypothetical protein